MRVLDCLAGRHWLVTYGLSGRPASQADMRPGMIKRPGQIARLP